MVNSKCWQFLCFMISHIVFVFVVVQTGPHVAQDILKLILLSRLPLHFWCPCLYLNHTGITGMGHNDPATCLLLTEVWECTFQPLCWMLLQIKCSMWHWSPTAKNERQQDKIFKATSQIFYAQTGESTGNTCMCRGAAVESGRQQT